MEPSRAFIDVVIDGEDRTFDLTSAPTLSIGRSPQAGVVITDDPNVSRKHALIQQESSGEYYLSDLGLAIADLPRLLSALGAPEN